VTGPTICIIKRSFPTWWDPIIYIIIIERAPRRDGPNTYIINIKLPPRTWSGPNQKDQPQQAPVSSPKTTRALSLFVSGLHALQSLGKTGTIWTNRHNLDENSPKPAQFGRELAKTGTIWSWAKMYPETNFGNSDLNARVD